MIAGKISLMFLYSIAAILEGLEVVLWKLLSRIIEVVPLKYSDDSPSLETFVEISGWKIENIAGLQSFYFIYVLLSLQGRGRCQKDQGRKLQHLRTIYPAGQIRISICASYF